MPRVEGSQSRVIPPHGRLRNFAAGGLIQHLSRKPLVARDCHPLRGVATYGDVYKLTYVRGPSGIIVMLAEDLKKS